MKNNIKITFLTSLITLLLVLTGFGQIKRDAELSPSERQATTSVQDQLTTSRKMILDKNLNFRVGLTGVSDLDLKRLTGNLVSPDIMQIAANQNQKAALILGINAVDLLNRKTIENIDFDKVLLKKINLAKTMPQLEIDRFGKVTDKNKKSTGGNGDSTQKPPVTPPPSANCYVASKRCDYRVGKTTVPIRFQQCGNCWAYAVEGLYEYGVLKNTGYGIDSSEQFLVSNGNAGNCDGGYIDKAAKFLESFGAMKEKDFPDTGTNGKPLPDLIVTYPYVGYNPIITWGFIDSGKAQPSVDDIKKAIVAHGTVAAAITATDAFKNYNDGIFDENASGKTNHAIMIVGWDDDKGAWIIRNSWGTNWGITADYGKERGYAYVKYNSNQVGKYAIFAVADKTAQKSY